MKLNIKIKEDVLEYIKIKEITYKNKILLKIRKVKMMSYQSLIISERI